MGSSVTESTSSDVLDLINFDACGHWSPYVLTSPRSLLACRKAKIKPNELLYKSAADVAKDLGVSIELAYPVYKKHEKLRQEKLEVCRQERNKYINSENSLHFNKRKKQKKKICFKNEIAFYRNNIASNMRRIKSIQNKLDEDQKTVNPSPKKIKKRRVRSKSISDLMELKELCKKVDRIAFFERNVIINSNVDNKRAVKRRTRSHTNNSRSLLDLDECQLPNQDRKILESMRRKREEQQHCEDLSQRVNLFWEQMHEEEKLLTNEQKKKWQNFVTAKRNVENGVNNIRLEELRQAFDRSQRKLEEQMKCRDEKVSELKREILERHELENSLKRSVEVNKREIASNNYNWEHMNALTRKKELNDKSILKQKKANEFKNKSLQMAQEKAKTLNRMEELRHAVQMEHIQTRHDNAIRRKFDECQAKEQRAFQNHLEKMATRMRELANKSLQREHHMGRVHRVARELEEGMQRWQDRVLVMQYEQQRRAKENAELFTDSKRLRAEIENKRKSLEHSVKMQRIKELENERLCIIKKEIEEEEDRIRRIREKKNLEIQMSRKLASSTAELRNEIRRGADVLIQRT
ncbi:golgin subfamily A member 6-like protein 22 isoform X2 [Daktulosphaira vitifoliae]|uniref:golgin subfamily A member 6-like protein 22 isoform X2 n=2 Tax=Daktulosphaira vitifoliae TaxID=58002 RepID=UPI0021AB034A|nr:golgin subfamily A member 6-like protein 22 isoform X2 [Daktulosphaira vitifoliae]